MAVTSPARCESRQKIKSIENMQDRKQKRVSKSAGPKLRKLSSSHPDARDEGPRLLPLPERRDHDSAAEISRRYIDLAEAAIGRKGPSTERPKSSRKKHRTK
jgi:hypothetical protein